MAEDSGTPGQGSRRLGGLPVSPAAEHAPEQVVHAGRGLGADLVLLIRQDGEETVHGLVDHAAPDLRRRLRAADEGDRPVPIRQLVVGANRPDLLHLLVDDRLEPLA
jgi:hypothetical protein